MQPSESESLRRGIRIDLIIAVCALLMSSLATGASWWQSRVVAQQLSAQVWPYLSIGTTYDPGYVAFDITNDGLGPAIVRSAVLTVNGQPYADPGKAFRVVFKGHHKGKVSAHIRSLSPGTVIRGSSTVRVWQIDAAWATQDYIPVAGRIDFHICYCSLLGNCWLISALDASQDPHPVGTCPDVGKDQFLVRPGRVL
jgi:hypothetical protein